MTDMYRDLDSTPRDDLGPVMGVIAGTLDEWLFRSHGIMSSAHGAGTFLEIATTNGLTVELS